MSSVRLYFKSQAIREDSEFLCLTDMWRAAEAPESKRPAEWMRSKQAQEFGEFLAENLGVGNSHSALVRSESGGVGGSGATWAHWQLAMAYAKYLSPEFHAWCNDVVRAVMQGRAPSSVAVDVRAITQAVVQAITPLVQESTSLAREAMAWAKDTHRRLDLIERHVANSGTISPSRVSDLRRQVGALADLEASAGRWKKGRPAAIADIYREMSDATEWGRAGKPWSSLPANLEPAARAVLRRRQAVLQRSMQAPQLTLLKGETR